MRWWQCLGCTCRRILLFVVGRSGPGDASASSPVRSLSRRAMKKKIIINYIKSPSIHLLRSLRSKGHTGKTLATCCGHYLGILPPFLISAAAPALRASRGQPRDTTCAEDVGRVLGSSASTPFTAPRIPGYTGEC